MPVHHRASGGTGSEALAVERRLRGAAPHEALRPNIMDELDDATALGVAEYLRGKLLEQRLVPLASPTEASHSSVGPRRPAGR